MKIREKRCRHIEQAGFNGLPLVGPRSLEQGGEDAGGLIGRREGAADRAGIEVSRVIEIMPQKTCRVTS